MLLHNRCLWPLAIGRYSAEQSYENQLKNIDSALIVFLTRFKTVNMLICGHGQLKLLYDLKSRHTNEQ